MTQFIQKEWFFVEGGKSIFLIMKRWLPGCQFFYWLAGGSKIEKIVIYLVKMTYTGYFIPNIRSLYSPISKKEDHTNCWNYIFPGWELDRIMLDRLIALCSIIMSFLFIPCLFALTRAASYNFTGITIPTTTESTSKLSSSAENTCMKMIVTDLHLYHLNTHSNYRRW